VPTWRIPGTSRRVCPETLRCTMMPRPTTRSVCSDDAWLSSCTPCSFHFRVDFFVFDHGEFCGVGRIAFFLPPFERVKVKLL